MPDECESLIHEHPLPYRELRQEERDTIILNLLRSVHSGELEKVGEARQPVWERGWAENLEAFKKSNFDYAALLPRYTHLGEPIRMHGDYVAPQLPDFEITLSRILRGYLFATYLSGVGRIYEFGCGTGLNLVQLSRLFPDKQLTGLDWVDSAAEIIKLLRIHLNKRISYRYFNLLRPEPFDLGEDAGVITVTALEQVYNRHRSFISFLLEQRPSVVIHVEPIEEFYDEDTLVGYLGATYHRERKYLADFLPYLKDLEASGRVEIINLHKTGFGIHRHDPFSYVVWRPRG